MTVTTDDCKDFITAFLQKNPQILLALFGDEDPQQTKDLLDLISEKKNWRRVSKRKPDVDDVTPFDDDLVGIYVDGKRPNRYGETTGTVPTKDVNWVREFRCGNDTDIGFLVIELMNGILHLGQHRD